MKIAPRPAIAALSLLLALLAAPAHAQETAVGHFNAGVRNYRQGDLPASIAEFTKAIELNPEYWKAYTSRGVAKRDSGDLDGAVSDHSKSIELNPKNAAAYSNRGAVYRDQKKLDAALADYSTALLLDPN